MRSSIVLLVLLLCVPCVAVADGPAAILVGDSAMVPMRAVFEWLSATVTYSGGRITAVRGTDTVNLTVDSKQASINGRAVVLPTPPVLRGGTTYVPLRFVAESMGAVVAYNGEGGQVTVVDGDRTLTIPLAGTDPVELAIEVFRLYVRTGPPARTYGARNCLCFDPSKYEWMRGERWPVMTDDSFGVKDTDQWPFTDVRFQELLRQKGWKRGDLWFPYKIQSRSASQMVVQFDHRWWSASVELRRQDGQWKPTKLLACDEGVDAVYTWRVVKDAGGFRLVQEH